MRPSLLPILAALVFSASPVLAQQTPSIDAQPPKPVTIIQAGTLLAVPGERPSDEKSVVIRDGKIVEILDGYVAGDGYDGAVEVVDLRDKFVMPGMMDMHVHLTFQGYPPKPSIVSDSDYAMKGVEYARVTLLAGITTVRDVGARSGEAIIAVRDAINAGGIPGPTVLAAAESISATAGHGDTRGQRVDIADATLSKAMCDGPYDCRRAVRDQYKLGADVIKVHATGGGADPNGKVDSAPEMFDDELEAIAQTAHNLGIKVTAHAHGTAGIKAALRAGIDSIEHSTWLDDEAIDMYLQTGAYMIPTSYLQDYFLSRPNIPEHVQQARRENVVIIREKQREAIRRGVNVAMGTDAGIMPHGQNAREVSTYVALGMTPMEAIESATVKPAALMEIDDHVGTLETGMDADIIAMDGDPLQDITALHEISFVMRRGVVHKNE